MRVLLLLGVFFLSAWAVTGCSSSQTVTDEVKSYQCPSCKDKLVWSYNTKGLPTGKQVEHSCPGCKRGWASNVSLQSMCTECGKEHLNCPMCQKHSQ